jgi:hypothetical protein
MKVRFAFFSQGPTTSRTEARRRQSFSSSREQICAIDEFCLTW